MSVIRKPTRPTVRSPETSPTVPGNPWTPALIATEAWFDAADAGTITESGGSVSQWDDKGPNGWDVAEGSGSRQPATGSRTINGVNVLDFDGGDELSHDFAVPMCRNVDEFLIIAVCQPDTTGGGGDIITEIDKPGGSTRCKHQVENSKYSAAGRRLDGDGYTELDATFSYTLDAVIFGTVFDYANAQMNWTLNGTLDTPQAFQTAGFTSDTDAAAFHIGARGGYGEAFIGAIGEVLYVPSVNTDTRQLLEGYLAWKWGLVGLLPAGHPYKTKQPEG